MNPYQSPKCKEPAAEVAEQAVIRVRYGLGYTLLILVGTLCFLIQGVRHYHRPTGYVGGVSIALAAMNVFVAVQSRRRAYFEVFEDRLEFLSLGFPRWRSKKPLGSVSSNSYHRWFARREDFTRFVAWRDGRRG